MSRKYKKNRVMFNEPVKFDIDAVNLLNVFNRSIVERIISCASRTPNLKINYDTIATFLPVSIELLPNVYYTIVNDHYVNIPLISDYTQQQHVLVVAI